MHHIQSLLMLTGSETDLDILDGWDQHGDTPLCCAARQSRQDVALYLLQQGANINLQNWQGRSPIMQASRCGRLDMCHLLLQHGADKFLVDHFGQNALHMHGKPGIVQLLISSGGVDVDAVDGRNYTALMWAATYNFKTIVKMLLSRGASLTVEDNVLGYTARSIASLRMHFDVVEIIEAEERRRGT